jgi:hypothetical protein
LPVHDAEYYSEDGIGPALQEIHVLLADNFPLAKTDLSKAGTCYACGLYTATVFHLMKLAEFGLISIAEALSVPKDKQSAGWDVLLRECYSSLKNISGSTPKIPHWQQKRQAYSDLLALLELVKDAWRNPVSHVPAIYEASQARRMFAHVHSLMDRLKREGLREIPMPSALALPSIP